MSKDRKGGWYTIAGSMVVTGAAVGTMGWTPRSLVLEVGAIIITFAGFALATAVMYEIPDIIRARVRDRKIPISIEPRRQRDRIDLTVINEGKDTANFRVVVRSIYPLPPENPPTPWVLGWTGTQTVAHPIDPGEEWTVCLGTGQLRRDDPGGPEGGFALKRLGLEDVVVLEHNGASGPKEPPSVVLAVRASRVGLRGHIDRRFRISFDSKSSGNEELYPRIEDVSYRPAKPGNRLNRILAGSMAVLAVAIILAIVVRIISFGPDHGQRPLGFEKRSHARGNVHRAPSCSQLPLVRLAVGSGTVPFFEDPKVLALFCQHGFRIHADGPGSRQMARANLAYYDALVPGSEVAAEELQHIRPKILRHQPTFALFASPLAIATYQPIATCLQSLGIATYTQNVWYFSIGTYLAAVRKGLQWSQCPGLSLTGQVALTTTDPRCSNSSEMFIADISWVENGNSLIVDLHTADSIGRALAPIMAAGFSEKTSQVLFNDYLHQGMDSIPMVLTYEAAFLHQEIADPSQMTPDMRLMYPTPNIFSQRTLIPDDQPGDNFGRLLMNLVTGNPELIHLTQATYGFRLTSPSEFQKLIANLPPPPVFGTKITVPTQFPSAKVPKSNILRQLIDAALPPNASPTC